MTRNSLKCDLARARLCNGRMSSSGRIDRGESQANRICLITLSDFWGTESSFGSYNTAPHHTQTRLKSYVGWKLEANLDQLPLIFHAIKVVWGGWERAAKSRESSNFAGGLFWRKMRKRSSILLFWRGGFPCPAGIVLGETWFKGQGHSLFTSLLLRRQGFLQVCCRFFRCSWLGLWQLLGLELQALSIQFM